MVEFKIVLSDPKTGRAYNLNVSAGQAGSLIGKKIGDEIDAGSLGISGYRIKITGASDRIGTPARRDLPGVGRKKLLLSKGVGFRQAENGQRQRKSIRGSEITADFVQINARVTQHGEKALETYFEKPEEKTADKASA
jgi:small subunit ribosomal protein S6e